MSKCPKWQTVEISKDFFTQLTDYYPISCWLIFAAVIRERLLFLLVNRLKQSNDLSISFQVLIKYFHHAAVNIKKLIFGKMVFKSSHFQQKNNI